MLKLKKYYCYTTTTLHYYRLNTTEKFITYYHRCFLTTSLCWYLSLAQLQPQVVLNAFTSYGVASSLVLELLIISANQKC